MPLPLMTARLALRAYDPDDAAQMHEVLYADPEAMRFLGGARRFDQTVAVARRYAEDHVRRGYAPWVVEDRESGLIVGEAGLQPFDDRGPEIELCYAFGRAAWGRGLATEAGSAILDEAFGALGADEVVAVADDRNLASLRVLEKLGFRPDGRRVAWGGEKPFLRRRADDGPPR